MMENVSSVISKFMKIIFGSIKLIDSFLTFISNLSLRDQEKKTRMDPNYCAMDNLFKIFKDLIVVKQSFESDLPPLNLV